MREAAIAVSFQRKPPSQSQRILAQYHAQYMDLQAAIAGLSPQETLAAPAVGEWSVKEAYAHILGAEFGFRAVIRFALEGHRSGTWTPEPPAESEYPRLYGISRDDYDALMNGSLDKMIAFHRELHPLIIREFESITDQELDLPSAFWEEKRFPIRFRLHRFEAHILQHAIQIDKTTAIIGVPAAESRRLIRYIFAALADVNGAMIGAEEVDNAPLETLADQMNERVREIAGLLNL